ncbi:hypothetical protein [Flectobacillus sp. BAB-3569]|uniref:hypothetical protein n=1 Tax=Flectobacillus sp. BAB-3569 TaxID=1509483 RepID=UPI000BA3BE99|nr:hypothetical protein [Flectobacillus sp. BAB-3569]PAC29222.1 hypothetical protein BWI92_16470 [Flectobacillus sp. BAB-3569]
MECNICKKEYASLSKVPLGKLCNVWACDECLRIIEKLKKQSTMEKVEFRVLRFEDSRSSQSELEIGGVYTGEIDKNRVYFTDQAGDNWTFYLNDTCELV